MVVGLNNNMKVFTVHRKKILSISYKDYDEEYKLLVLQSLLREPIFYGRGMSVAFIFVRRIER